MTEDLWLAWYLPIKPTRDCGIVDEAVFDDCGHLTVLMGVARDFGTSLYAIQQALTAQETQKVAIPASGYCSNKTALLAYKNNES